MTCGVAIAVFVSNLAALFRLKSLSSNCRVAVTGVVFNLAALFSRTLSNCLGLCVLGNETKIFCAESSWFYFRNDISPLVTLFVSILLKIRKS